MVASGDFPSKPRVLTPQEYAADVEALAALVNLKLLDRYWTLEARRAPGERASLAPVVDDMTRLLATLATLAPQVAATSAKYAPQLQPIFEDQKKNRPRLRERDIGEDVATSAARVADVLVKQSGAEVEHLKTENSRIEQEQPSQGDLTADFDGALDVFGYHIEVHLHLEIESGTDVVGAIGSLLGAIGSIF